MNEHLAPGTEVFVAEMGTYGPGEIAELCAWVKPDGRPSSPPSGRSTSSGCGTIDAIVEAKAEILDQGRDRAC